MTRDLNSRMRAPIKTFKRARRLRRDMTLPEVLLWQALRAGANGARFRRQHPVGPFVLDFFCASARLAIEVDGAAHDNAERAEKDQTRDRWLAHEGIRVLRFNARDVLDPHMRENVLETIAAVVGDVRA